MCVICRLRAWLGEVTPFNMSKEDAALMDVLSCGILTPCERAFARTNSGTQMLASPGQFSAGSGSEKERGKCAKCKQPVFTWQPRSKGPGGRYVHQQCLQLLSSRTSPSPRAGTPNSLAGGVEP